MAHLWFVGYHFGPFHIWKGTDMCCFMVKKLPLLPALSFVCYHYGQFMVDTLPLWPVLRLQNYHRVPFPRWYANITARFMVCKLPLWPILWLESYHCVTFYGR